MIILIISLFMGLSLLAERYIHYKGRVRELKESLKGERDHREKYCATMENRIKQYERYIRCRLLKHDAEAQQYTILRLIEEGVV